MKPAYSLYKKQFNLILSFVMKKIYISDY